MQAETVASDGGAHRSREARSEPFVGRFARGLAGALAAGLAALAVVLLAAEVFAANTGVRGPGAVVIVGHVLAAALAVGGAVVADRVRGALAAVALVGVVLITVGTLWAFWLA